jgi:hypothetical protein
MTPRLSDLVALRVNDEPISLSDALMLGKWRGTASRLADDARDAALIRQAARERNIAASDDEVQEAADAFRKDNRLEQAQAMLNWLQAHHLSVEEWQACLEQDILARKLCDALAPPGKVEAYFAENRRAFDRAVISRLVIADEEMARRTGAPDRRGRRGLPRACPPLLHRGRNTACQRVRGLVARNAVLLPWRLPSGARRAPERRRPVAVDRTWHLVKVEALRPATLG